MFFRWAQVTEELRQALWELEEEKEKRRQIEEDMILRIQEQDDLKSELGALLEEKEKQNAVTLLANTPAGEGDVWKEEQLNMKEMALPSDHKEGALMIVSVQEAGEASESVKDGLDLSNVGQIQTLQVY